jgi:hypothetical protein
MTTPYSKVLAKRAIWMGGWVVAMLLATAWWQHQQKPVTEDTVFRPHDRIAQVNAAIESLGGEFLPQSDSPNRLSIPCEGRSLGVLKARLMAQFGWASEEVDRRLKQAVSSSDRWTGCGSFLQAFQLAIALSSSGTNQTSINIDSVGQQLTEDVTWDRNLPCILGSAHEQTILLAGNAMNCEDPTYLRSIATLPKDASYRQLTGALAKALTISAIGGQLKISGTTHLSLDAQLHAGLDRWAQCEGDPTCTNSPTFKGLKALSLVAMDAETGAVLAVWCKGRLCEKAQSVAPGAMAATLLEAPPASTTKLLFAMSLASKQRVSPNALQLQIKTSGQNDGKVSKRNEWWERQAICDTEKNDSCSVPANTREISDAFGFNLNCQPNSSQCGRLGLVSAEVPNLSPGLVGRLAIQTQKGGVKMIDWSLYDEIRQGKKPAEGGAAYTETSRAVQAVLGAGNSRISAMGLAVMPMQLWRISQNKTPMLPSLTTERRPLKLATSNSPRLTQAAITVLGGMRKAVQPEEEGWVGAGTIASAFKSEMKRDCVGSCGIWGKTGTVSQQDPGFAGTSLFTGLIDTQEFAQWRGDAHRPQSSRRKVSLGVIAIPEKGVLPTHAASMIAMAAVNQIIVPTENK